LKRLAKEGEQLTNDIRKKDIIKHLKLSASMILDPAALGYFEDLSSK
jgi:hypothetical protein